MHRTPVLTAPALLAAVLILAALGGCTAASPEKTSSSQLNPVTELKVSVSYRERMLLPPGCVLFVELQNISQLNPENNDVGNAFLPVKAAPPFKAVLRYDPDRIIAQLHYSVSVRIEFKGQVLFSGGTRIDPLSWPKDKPVEVLVTMPKR
ncbi:MAG: YbaY family lipoprotein [Pseudodesulfovibrio sp.]|uniref:YbaY family lipoprotein n=1 Tax=Pseudodesulfovibrio sp. TaxID=2035812 RepID=UPI003D10AA35